MGSSNYPIAGKIVLGLRPLLSPKQRDIRCWGLHRPRLQGTPREISWEHSARTSKLRFWHMLTKKSRNKTRIWKYITRDQKALVELDQIVLARSTWAFIFRECSSWQCKASFDEIWSKYLKNVPMEYHWKDYRRYCQYCKSMIRFLHASSLPDASILIASVSLTPTDWSRLQKMEGVTFRALRALRAVCQELEGWRPVGIQVNYSIIWSEVMHDGSHFALAARNVGVERLAEQLAFFPWCLNFRVGKSI